MIRKYNQKTLIRRKCGAQTQNIMPKVNKMVILPGCFASVCCCSSFLAGCPRLSGGPFTGVDCIVNKIITLPLMLVLSIGWLSAGAYADADNIALIERTANDPYRSESHRQRNRYRHPAQTLDFFGITAQMKVIELWPLKGWYTEILGPLLKARGQLTIANFRHQDQTDDKKSNYYAKLGRKLILRLRSESAFFGPVKEVLFDPQRGDPLGMPESQDMVVTFRNIHNWDSKGNFKKVMAAAFAVLKPGGILGIVEHRADQVSDISSSAVEGYSDENYVISVVESVGFSFAGRSGINANAKDRKNHPKGVYALPPTLAMGDVDREKYLSIGESDRMTLKFIKQVNSND